MKVTMTLGVVRTKGTKLVYWNKYKKGRDFGFNLIPSRFGLYFWILVGEEHG